jgi:hypothetical protein
LACLGNGATRQARRHYAEHPHLEGERRVVTDQRGQLEQAILAQGLQTGLILLVRQVRPRDEGPGQGRDRAFGWIVQDGEPASPDGVEFGVGEASRPGDPFVRVDLESTVPRISHGQDGELASSVAEPGRVAHTRAQRLQRTADRGAEQHRVERTFQPPVLILHGEQLRSLAAGTADEVLVEGALGVVEIAELELAQPLAHWSPSR